MAERLHDALERLVGEPPPMADPLPALRLATRRARLRRPTIAGLSAVLVLAGGFGVLHGLGTGGHTARPATQPSAPALFEPVSVSAQGLTMTVTLDSPNPPVVGQAIRLVAAVSPATLNAATEPGMGSGGPQGGPIDPALGFTCRPPWHPGNTATTMTFCQQVAYTKPGTYLYRISSEVVGPNGRRVPLTLLVKIPVAHNFGNTDNAAFVAPRLPSLTVQQATASGTSAGLVVTVVR